MSEINTDKAFTARMEDLCSRACRTYTPCYTPFLTAKEQVAAKRTVSDFPDLFVLAFGGFSAAERAILGLFPSDIYLPPEAENRTDERYRMYEAESGIAFLQITGSGFTRFDHRDVLGALMATGLRRETMGDIYVADDGKNAYLAVLQTVAPFLCDALTGVGRDKVHIKPLAAEDLPQKAERFADLSVTLASLRLDALLSGALNVSREQAKKLVSSGRVSINHVECTAVDRLFAEGDIVSVKGHGRFLIDSFLGKTQKDRFRVIVRKYL
ncbi:MAG: RNA-binding protein [Eubacteriales bacterium]|jgi:RNA-binding protein YlmH